MKRTANKMYKEYRAAGGQLTFKEFIQREKAKGFLNTTGQKEVPVNKPLADTLQKTIEDMRRQAGYKDHLEGKYILGINRNVFIGVGVLAAVGLGFYIYKKQKW